MPIQRPDRHDLLQPASVASLILDELERKNRDPALNSSLRILRLALNDLALQIDRVFAQPRH
jgi:hypothetical protein